MCVHVYSFVYIGERPLSVYPLDECLVRGILNVVIIWAEETP